MQALLDDTPGVLKDLPPENFIEIEPPCERADVLNYFTEIKLNPKVGVVVQGGRPIPWNIPEDGFFTAYIQKIIEY